MNIKNSTSLSLFKHLSYGLKAVVVEKVNISLETLRQSLGGAGFSQFSFIAGLAINFKPFAAIEGDGTVML